MSTPSRTGPLPWLPTRLPRPLRWLAGIAGSLLLAWMVLAIGFAPLPWPGLRWVLAAAFALLAFPALWRSRRRWHIAVLALAVLAWCAAWASISPSHDWDWRPGTAVMPRVQITRGRVVIHDYRNFEYRSVDDFTPRWETRELSLSKLQRLDFHVSYWRPGPVAHTFVSFVFEDADPVVVSIETRAE